VLVLSPGEVAKLERFWPLAPMVSVLGREKPFGFINTNPAHVADLLPSGEEDLQQLSARSDCDGQERHYLLRFDDRSGVVKIGFLESVTGKDIVEAFLQAHLIKRAVSHPDKSVCMESVATDSATLASAHVAALLSAMRGAGWDTEHLFVEPHVVRFSIEH